MLDTIVLTLGRGMYYVSEPDWFEPSARLILDENSPLGGRGYIPAKQNPTKRELQNGCYKPRLTLTNRFNHTGRREVTLKIELSLPKLLFGNNFDELVQSDFEPVTSLLLSKLKEMGVRVFTQALEDAPVSAIHYGKNIPLIDGSTPHYLISRIKEANIQMSLDVNQTDYRNDGHSYKWHSNSYEVAFYDKIKDLEITKKSEKRAEENDNTLQLGLFDTLRETKRLEVLRMEVRLNKRQKIKQLFNMLGIDSELTYKNLFSSTISQRVLLHYLNELESKRLPLFDYKPTSQRSLLADLVICNPDLGPLKTVQLFGLKQIFNCITPRDLRAMFAGYSQRSWYRLIAEAKTVKLPIATSPFKVIHECISRFEPLKLAEYQN